jgi:RHS repeat-associated protein
MAMGRVRRVVTGAGAGTTIYVYDAFGQLAVEYSTVSQAAGTRYIVRDFLGSVRMVTDGAGNPVSTYDYLPFGEEIPAAWGVRGPAYMAPDGVSQRFTSKERDSETGLDYFGARYFSGAQGRMTSPDPFMIMTQAENREQLDAYLSNPQTWNRYAYALNNPLRYVDPTGLDPISVEDCQKDSTCTVVKLNVILNTNADLYDRDGNLRQEYQSKLDTQLAQAADEYGNANIAFDLNYSKAAVDANYVGEAGAINAVVTDSNESFSSKSWVGPSGASYTRLNIGTSLTSTYRSTLAHELSHHLTGDTRSWGIPFLSNAIADDNNDLGRAILRNWSTPGGRVLRTIDPFLYLNRRNVMQNARRWYGGR